MLRTAENPTRDMKQVSWEPAWLTDDFLDEP